MFPDRRPEIELDLLWGDMNSEPRATHLVLRKVKRERELDHQCPQVVVPDRGSCKVIPNHKVNDPLRQRLLTKLICFKAVCGEFVV